MLEFPARCNQDRGTDLASGTLHRDEKRVDDDHPENVWEEGRLDGFPYGVARAGPFGGDVEEAEFRLVGARAVGFYVEAGTGFAWGEGVDFFAGWRWVFFLLVSMLSQKKGGRGTE